jgi:dihydrofolate reductase
VDPVVLSIVCALAQNRVIGRDNQLPWRLPRDLAYFKKITLGHPIIMGRKTFDSIGRPLPGRTNIVVTRQVGWSADGVVPTGSLDAALELATRVARDNGVKEVMLIGGANLYEQALPLAAKLYLTEVHTQVPGDAFFPEFSRAEWIELTREDYAADTTNPIAHSFVVYEKRAGADLKR